MNNLHDVKLLLLDMISSARPADPNMIARLTEQDWQAIGKMAAQHRLEPLLHHQLQTIGVDWTIPTNVREFWAARYRQSALRSLSLQRTLLTIDRLLNAAGITYVALKGAWLAWHAYSHPALRPMRDLDILVPFDQTLKTFDILLEADFDRSPHFMAPLDYAIKWHKHLPPIVDRRTNVMTEVHSRLNTDVNDNIAASTAKLLDARMTALIGNTPISYLSKIDSLLHLIEHSAYDHRFNNGPVVLNDIAMLLKSGPVEWEAFWVKAEATNRTRGSSLIFSLVEHYHGEMGIEWPVGRRDHAPKSVINAAALMMLQDFDDRGLVDLAAKVRTAPSLSKLLSLSATRLGTSRHILAQFSGLPLHSKLTWFSYPFWLATKMFQYTWSFRKPSLRSETARAKQVVQWLDDHQVTNN